MSRRDRRDRLRAALDDGPVKLVGWPSFGRHEHYATAARNIRLDDMWRKTGPGRRDRWAAAIARDLDRRARVDGVLVEVDRVEVQLANSSAAEIVAREIPRLVPPPPGMFKASAVEVERAVRDAEHVLGGRS